MEIKTWILNHSYNFEQDDTKDNLKNEACWVIMTIKEKTMLQA